jgi:hypothetical protein
MPSIIPWRIIVASVIRLPLSAFTLAVVPKVGNDITRIDKAAIANFIMWSTQFSTESKKTKNRPFPLAKMAWGTTLFTKSVPLDNLSILKY